MATKPQLLGDCPQIFEQQQQLPTPVYTGKGSILSAECVLLLHVPANFEVHPPVQGSIDTFRRDYQSAFEGIRSPAVLSVLQKLNESLLLVGRTGYNKFSIPRDLQMRVQLKSNLPFLVSIKLKLAGTQSSSEHCLLMQTVTVIHSAGLL